MEPIMKNTDNSDLAEPRRKATGRLARTGVAAIAVLALAAAPARAATITTKIAINGAWARPSIYADAYVTVTYTCSANSGVQDIGVFWVDGTIYAVGTGGASTTCDGLSHRVNISVGPGTAGDQASADACLVDAQNNTVNGASTYWNGTVASKPPAAAVRQTSAPLLHSLPGIPCSS